MQRCSNVAPVDHGKYGQDIRDRCFRFACRIVKFCGCLYEQDGVARVLEPQLARCGTSVGENLEEARGGESRKDFASKCAISLKEARESKFRLRVAVSTRLGPPTEAQALAREAEELAAILGAIVLNTRRNAINQPRHL
jgi:four helix bundle protein